MKYFRHNKENHLDKQEITYDKALDILLGTWKDNDMTRDMLTIPNRILCRYSDVTVMSDDGMVLMAGLYNMLPMNAEYDDNGNRTDVIVLK